MSKPPQLTEAAAAEPLPPSPPNGDTVKPGNFAVAPLSPLEHGAVTPKTRLDQIRGVGCALLYRNGYSGMTMREIANVLSIKAASLYYHYVNKQHILFEIMEATVSELLAGLREIAENGEEPEAQLDSAIRWHVRFHTEKREEAFVSHSELRSLEPDNLRTILKLRREYDRLFDSILKRGLRKGVFRMEQPSVVRNCILTMCTATGQWFSPEGPLSAEDVATEISRFVRAALVKGDATALTTASG